MSGHDVSEIDRDIDVPDEVTGRALLGALRGTWYLWLGTLATAVLTWIAVTFQNLGQSFFEELLFGSLTVVFLVAASVQVLRKWRAVDRFHV